MPRSRGGHRALLPAREVAAWERLHPGTAAAVLAEYQRDRRHARAMDWARLALQGVMVLCGLGAVTALALLGPPLVGPEGSIHGTGLYLGVGSVMGLLAGRLQPIRRSLCGGWPKGQGDSADPPE
jgi:integral membrane sensor domain MASE1